MRLGDEHAVAANKKKAQQKTRLVLPVRPLEFRVTGREPRLLGEIAAADGDVSYQLRGRP